MKVKLLLKPHYLICAQYMLITLIIFSKNHEIQNLSNLLKIFYLPAILYIAFVFLLVYLKKNKQGFDNKTNFRIFKVKNTYQLLEIIIYSCICIFIISLIEIMKDVNTFNLFSLFNKQNILYLQRNPGKILSLSIALMNIIPVVLIIYYDYYIKQKKSKSKFIILFIYLLLCLLICSINGIRFLFLVNFIPVFLYSTYNYFIDIKLLKNIFFLGIALFIIVIGGQSIKTQNYSIKDNVLLLTEYYTESINNVVHLVNNEYSSLNENYWTIYRPLKGVPYINFVNLDEWYIEKYGYIPITNRDEDFDYAIKLGIQPKNNTFSIWGYSYLDYGDQAWFLILLQLIFIQTIYYLSNRNIGFKVFYCFLYLFMIEQIRTNGIISPRVINAAILLIILFLIDKMLFYFAKQKT